MLSLQKIELACVTLIRSAKPGTFQRNSVCFDIAKKNRLKLCSFAFVNTYFSAFFAYIINIVAETIYHAYQIQNNPDLLCMGNNPMDVGLMPPCFLFYVIEGREIDHHHEKPGF